MLVLVGLNAESSQPGSGETSFHCGDFALAQKTSSAFHSIDSERQSVLHTFVQANEREDGRSEESLMYGSHAEPPDSGELIVAHRNARILSSKCLLVENFF